jgi:hypothetical protein
VAMQSTAGANRARAVMYGTWSGYQTLVGNGSARTGSPRWRRLTGERSRTAKSVFHFDVRGIFNAAKSDPLRQFQIAAISINKSHLGRCATIGFEHRG